MKLAAVGCIFAALLWSQTPNPEKTVYEGVVRDAVTRVPIVKASVRLTPLGKNGTGYAGISGETGGFRFVSVAPGMYEAKVQSRGYGETTAWVEFAAGKSLTGAVIELQPESIITGRVTDGDGDPVAGATVAAMEEKWRGGLRILQQVSSATVADNGEYRLKVLPGRYYLTARPPNEVEPWVFTEGPGGPEMRMAQIFHPNAVDFEGASVVEVAPGQQLPGMAFKLKAMASYHVRGTVRLLSPPAPQVMVALNPRNGARTTANVSFGASVQKDGTFDIMGVLPGSYWLDLWPLRGSPTGRMAVDVTDRDLNGIKLPAIPQFEFKGRIRVADDGFKESLTLVKFNIEWLDWVLFPYSAMASPAADGTFSFPNRPVGTYVIWLRPLRDLYIQSILYNGREVEGGRIDATSGPQGEIEVVVATGTGTVEGHATAGANAVLVSASGQTGNTGARSMTLDASGHFEFLFVPPGRYLVFASPRFEEGLWRNQDFIEQIRQRGVAVEVTAKGTATVEVEGLAMADLVKAIDKVPR